MAPSSAVPMLGRVTVLVTVTSVDPVWLRLTPLSIRVGAAPESTLYHVKVMGVVPYAEHVKVALSLTNRVESVGWAVIVTGTAGGEKAKVNVHHWWFEGQSHQYLIIHVK